MNTPDPATLRWAMDPLWAIAAALVTVIFYAAWLLRFARATHRPRFRSLPTLLLAGQLMVGIVCAGVYILIGPDTRSLHVWFVMNVTQLLAGLCLALMIQYVFASAYRVPTANTPEIDAARMKRQRIVGQLLILGVFVAWGLLLTAKYVLLVLLSPT